MSTGVSTMPQFFGNLVNEITREEKDFFSEAVESGFIYGQRGHGPWVGNERLVRVLIATKNCGRVKVRYTNKTDINGPTLRGLPKTEDLPDHEFQKFINKWKIQVSHSFEIIDLLN